MVTTRIKIIPRPTMELPAKRRSRPTEGIRALEPSVILYASECEESQIAEFAVKIPLTKYKAIQLSMMPEMTSFTLKNAFNTPEIIDHNAPATMAPIITNHQGQLAATPMNVMTKTAMEYCPEAPRLNRPAL